MGPDGSAPGHAKPSGTAIKPYPQLLNYIANPPSVAPSSPNTWVNLSHVLERPEICGPAEQGYIKGSRLFKQAACERSFVTVSFDGHFHAETASRQHEATKMNLNVSNRYMRSSQCHLAILLWRHTNWYNLYRCSWEYLPHHHCKIIIY